MKKQYKQTEVQKLQVPSVAFKQKQSESVVSSRDQSWLDGEEQSNKGDIDFYLPDFVPRTSASFTATTREKILPA